MDPKIVANDNDLFHGRLDDINRELDILELRMEAIIQAAQDAAEQKLIDHVQAKRK